ncbi:uncharacterized protein [Watersipora subatra]|uniref:uncharacterized protein n=1 Tax=Watersipora subatra TaxID=2589382 RepID=UPI00355B3D0E
MSSSTTLTSKSASADYESEAPSLSGSDFTLYSEEAKSDDLDNEEDYRIDTTVGELIAIDGKKVPPPRPPQPAKASRRKKSPALKKRVTKKKPSGDVGVITESGHSKTDDIDEETQIRRESLQLSNFLDSSASIDDSLHNVYPFDNDLLQRIVVFIFPFVVIAAGLVFDSSNWSAADLESTEEEYLQSEKISVIRRSSRTKSPKQVHRRAAQKMREETRETIRHLEFLETNRKSTWKSPSEANQKKLLSKSSPQDIKESSPSFKKTQLPSKKADVESNEGEKPRLAKSISNSLSIEEVRAAGDGASEDNDPIDLRNQSLVDLEQEHTASKSDRNKQMKSAPTRGKRKKSKTKRYCQSASIDSQPAPSGCQVHAASAACLD